MQDVAKFQVTDPSLRFNVEPLIESSHSSVHKKHNYTLHRPVTTFLPLIPCSQGTLLNRSWFRLFQLELLNEPHVLFNTGP